MITNNVYGILRSFLSIRLHNSRFTYDLRWCWFFFFSSRRRHTRFKCDWSSDVCSSDLVKLANGFLLIDSFKTLQAFDFSADCLGDGVGEFGLATTRWSLKQDGFIQPGREVYDRGGHLVGEVPNRGKSFLRLLG